MDKLLDCLDGGCLMAEQCIYIGKLTYTLTKEKTYADLLTPPMDEEI